ncbi:MAG: CBS domain-containing protein [Velocimicrobium sp.]
MNILFFLTPKNAVSYIYDTDSIYCALTNIRNSGFTSIPIITKTGKYIGAITEGDFLWNYIDMYTETSKEVLQSTPVSHLKRRFQYKSVNVNADISDLFSLVYVQNFVPIVDDRGVFIGIVTRQEVIKHYCSCMQNTIANS